MLAERDSELVTAFLDGELGARQRKAALRLLRRSAEARQLLQKMQGDSQILRGLPAVRPPADLPLRVLGAIAERGLTPTQGSPLAPAAGKTLPAWVGLGLAAALLLSVTAGSFAFFRSELPPLVAHALPEPPKWAPLPDLPPGTYLAVAELAAEPARKQLTSTLAKDVAYHLDVRVSAPAARTVGRLADAFEGSGVKFLVDEAAKNKLTQGRSDTTYLVYAENLRPDQVSEVLQRFGGASQARGERIVLNPLKDSDRAQISTLMGLDPKELRPAVPELKEIIRDPKEGPKGKGKPKQPTPTPEPARFAVVLAHDGAAPLHGQLAEFLKSRGRARPGTLQVCFVVHEGSA
jgi:hypothetical protein